MEIIDLYDKNRQLLEETAVRGDKLPKGRYRLVVHICLFNERDEMLIQKRQTTQNIFANLWDLTAGGHVDAGERIVDGLIREVKEEIGVDVTEEECHFEFEYIEDKVHEIGQLYTIKIDKEENEFDIQKEEVDFVKWVTFEDFKNMFWSDNWAPYSDDFKNKTIKVLEKRIRG